MGLTYRGVNYDVGTDCGPGSVSREELLEEQMRGEIRAVRDELHCWELTCRANGRWKCSLIYRGARRE